VLYKGDAIILNMLLTNNWERPICMGATVRKSYFLGLNEYFQMEGLVYTLYPTKSSVVNRYELGGVNTEKSYQNLIFEFKWEGIDHVEAGRKVYYDTYSLIFSNLCKALSKKKS
jgi:hypothetical protein